MPKRDISWKYYNIIEELAGVVFDDLCPPTPLAETTADWEAFVDEMFGRPARRKQFQHAVRESVKQRRLPTDRLRELAQSAKPHLPQKRNGRPPKFPDFHCEVMLAMRDLAVRRGMTSNRAAGELVPNVIRDETQFIRVKEKFRKRYDRSFGALKKLYP